MATGKKGKDDSYYPLRWKVADFVENIVILHRTRAAIAIAVAGLLLVLAGLFVLGWSPGGGGDDNAEPDPTAVTDDPDTTIGQEANDENDNDVEDETGDETEDRAVQEVLDPSAGTAVEINNGTIRIVGGVPTTEAANASLELVSDFFGAFDVVDEQIIDESFSETDRLIVRITDPLLFAEGTAELNPNLFSIFDAVSDYWFANGDLTVEVRAHASDQELSDVRAEAVANQLEVALVEPGLIAGSGFGPDDLAPGQTGRIDLIIGQ